MIFYFSGTGNTRWVARQLAEGLHESLRFVPDELAPHDGADGGAPIVCAPAPGEAVGFAFPVYAWGPPEPVLDLVRRLELRGDEEPYCFFVCTCGDDMGRTRNILARALRKRGIRLHAGFFLNMPDCYVALPGFDVDSDEERTGKLNRAPQIVRHIVQAVGARQRDCFEEKPGWLPAFKSYVIRPLFNRYLITDRPFRADSRCIACGKCARACPVKNIVMQDGAPQWQGRCTGCLACFHHCPTHALQFGSRTKGKGQYLHDNYVRE